MHMLELRACGLPRFKQPEEKTFYWRMKDNCEFDREAMQTKWDYPIGLHRLFGREKGNIAGDNKDRNIIVVVWRDGNR